MKRAVAWDCVLIERNADKRLTFIKFADRGCLRKVDELVTEVSEDVFNMLDITCTQLCYFQLSGERNFIPKAPHNSPITSIMAMKTLRRVKQRFSQRTWVVNEHGAFSTGEGGRETELAFELGQTCK